MLPEVKAYFDAIDNRNLRLETDRIYRAHPVPDWDPTLSADQVAAYFEAEDKRNAALRELERRTRPSRPRPTRSWPLPRTRWCASCSPIGRCRPTPTTRTTS
ncbi:hypothetical protein [Nonomuraea sp. C10]|uniref:hypothetical protein n=1 Tax=Nonomuraea sp. C10 TaxID=2600577 RepID=UPI0011CD8DAC|nr:hypothetical protein [Nonomuraea sp. C10]TXK41464.1 hypothetical protein FR742_19505 [Nonomuraea sp. C10]